MIIIGLKDLINNPEALQKGIKIGIIKPEEVRQLACKIMRHKKVDRYIKGFIHAWVPNGYGIQDWLETAETLAHYCLKNTDEQNPRKIATTSVYLTAKQYGKGPPLGSVSLYKIYDLNKDYDNGLINEETIIGKDFYRIFKIHPITTIKPYINEIIERLTYWKKKKGIYFINSPIYKPLMDKLKSKKMPEPCK